MEHKPRMQVYNCRCFIEPSFGNWRFFFWIDFSSCWLLWRWVICEKSWHPFQKPLKLSQFHLFQEEVHWSFHSNISMCSFVHLIRLISFFYQADCFDSCHVYSSWPVLSDIMVRIFLGCSVLLLFLSFFSDFGNNFKAATVCLQLYSKICCNAPFFSSLGWMLIFPWQVIVNENILARRQSAFYG